MIAVADSSCYPPRSCRAALHVVPLIYPSPLPRVPRLACCLLAGWAWQRHTLDPTTVEELARPPSGGSRDASVAEGRRRMVQSVSPVLTHTRSRSGPI